MTERAAQPLRLEALLDATRHTPLGLRVGRVRAVSGITILCDGPDVGMGELCKITPRGGLPPVLAEVVGLEAGTVTLMAYGAITGLSAGCEVVAATQRNVIPVGPALLGRIIDAFGNPLDGGPPIPASATAPLEGEPINPMARWRIAKALPTGVRAIDALLTLGEGQRVGIFSGSGVGKTTLLGMIARHVSAQINVIALIGERGREVREFVEKQLAAVMHKTVVVVATSEQPALSRVRAGLASLAIAEHFRDQGQQVVLTFDSVTRYAMARREIGLAAGEPPTARGYTPSVFADLPKLIERCGTHPSGGSITALMTVLVEGDDFNEPVADALRATLDAHIVLSRELAQAGQYPAVDVLKSASRVMPDIVTPTHQAQAIALIRALALIERNRQIVDIGAYVSGANPELDSALAQRRALREFFSQREGGAAFSESLAHLT
ncbi:MAG: hypothetical protein RIR70_90, partial [Pseudomonadota bacterium]